MRPNGNPQSNRRPKPGIPTPEGMRVHRWKHPNRLAKQSATRRQPSSAQTN